MGGHYYAYIKSFEDGGWYNFNDSTVTRIEDADVQVEIQKMFGGGTNASTSSYMLQYRKFDPSLCSPTNENLLDITIGNDLIPDYLLDDINKDTEKLIAAELEKEEKLLKQTLRICEPGNSQNEEKVAIKKTQTLRELLAQYLAIKGNIFDPSAQKVRFRTYDPQLNVMLEVYDDLDKTMLQSRIHSYQLLKIELEPFEEYCEDWKYLKIIEWTEIGHEDEQSFDWTALSQMPYKLLRINYETGKVEDLEKLTAELTGIP